MKAIVKITKEVEIRKVLIDIHIRYVGDSEDDDVPTTLPLLKGSQWKAYVDIDTGKIEEWPDGVAINLHAKVCDEGVYTLYGDGGEIISVKDGYVPNGLIPGSYGDYVELEINTNGVITNWPSPPCISEFFGDDD